MTNQKACKRRLRLRTGFLVLAPASMLLSWGHNLSELNVGAGAIGRYYQDYFALTHVWGFSVKHNPIIGASNSSEIGRRMK